MPGRDFKLAVQLVYERRRGTSSHLHGYIANLPQTFDLPVTWSDQELEDLQYPFLVDMVCGSPALLQALLWETRLGTVDV